ncbi:MAG: molybdopterin molybdenumtransferase MoeA [Thermoleophilia bacterium]|nr:molybdopterin molybdenumtransferase MoeA [Thermoleophilia bacterium]
MTTFFRVVRVAEAVEGFRPGRRTRVETVALAAAVGRVPVCAVAAPHALPGFTRSSLDGYAVRASDTFGCSEASPVYLSLVGAVQMGSAADVTVGPGQAVAIPTGGALPEGADAIAMVEHASEALDRTVEVTAPVAPGYGVVRADEDVAAGAVCLRAGRAVSAHDVALLAALGVTELDVFARPRVAILSTGDEVVPPSTASLAAGQVRDATADALAALVREAGGEPRLNGIVRDNPGALTEALRAAHAESDVILVSAGSSVGARDTTAEAIAALGAPGIWCHGLALKPGKPTILAECAGVPVIGLPGNPYSALIVFRLVGAGVVRLIGGVTESPPVSNAVATLLDAVPSVAGRRDIVPVTLEADGARPLLGRSSQLSLLACADGLIQIPEEAGGLDAGTQVTVERLR